MSSFDQIIHDNRTVPLSYPEAFVKRVEEQLGEELPLFWTAMAEPAIRGLRMNPFRSGAEHSFRDAGAPISWVQGGYELPLDSMAGVTVAHEAGAFYLQEPCAMLPGAVMAARPGEKILDLCAAPGGKATQMGLDMAGGGLLVCNEPVPNRAAILSRNLERMGIPHGIVTRTTPDRLAEKWPGGFDGVLVDAPCSGEGMFRRHPEAREEWSPEKAAGCAERQREILSDSARMVRPGGRLVYSTCTWNPAENEQQVEDFLATHPEFSLEPFSLPGADGTSGMFTCWPHRTRGEGQFVAKLRRAGEGLAALPTGASDFRLPKDMEKRWRDSGLPLPMPNAVLGSSLVQIGEIPDLKGIPVLRLGLHLGQVKGKVIQPDHAAALAIHRPEAQKTELSDENALRYLAGEAIPGETRGWTILTWKGLSLGWGKGSDGMIRNHYPKGLRNAKLTI